MPRERDDKGHYVRQPTEADEALKLALAAAANGTPSTRPDPRGEMRANDAPHEETSRERAERRAAEIMGHLEGAMDEGADELALDNIQVPDGWTYEWKRQSVYGKSDPAYDTRLARTGWEPVPSKRHPAMMPKGHHGEITRDGLVLMERPKVITDRVKKLMYERARGAVRLKEQQLNEGPPGTFERVDERGRPTAKVRTTHSPVEIPVPTE
ncbi:MAG TPA: hypothetical protein VKQ70_15695 [Caulobacteraceae bacterium]|jgi:hypothetical protein|nr:hypothetical protein [Caulobacteraceae bacterium]